MRCPGCNKFASLELEEPVVESLDVVDGTVSVEVTITRTSECCGEEVKTATLEAEQDLSDELGDHLDDGDERHNLSVEEDGVEPVEESGGRYQKSYFGAAVSYSVYCDCQKDGADPVYSGVLQDKVAASEMEEV